MSRRTLLGTGAGIGIGALLLKTGKATCAAPLFASPADTAKHNMWIWRFDVDGSPQQIREDARWSGMGVLLKTHDGPDWMSEFDTSRTAISGPRRVREVADFFESQGVPFHAWGVVKGQDIEREAQICSEVLNAGARSMTFDLEPSDGGHYWQGTNASALAFGRAIRRLQPNAELSVAPDGRPWQIDGTPTAEFASFCNTIQPQTYWRTFDSPTNHKFIKRLGYDVGPEGVTPELIIDVTADKLGSFGLPVRPIGQGAANSAEWERFINQASRRQMDSVSVWRYGTAASEVWHTLKAMAPAPPYVAPEPEPEVFAPVAAPPEAAHLQPVGSIGEVPHESAAFSAKASKGKGANCDTK